MEEPEKLPRINGAYVYSEFKHLFHIENEYFFTIRELLLRPKKTVKTFLYENRKIYVKPLVFLIFSSILLSVLLHFLHAKYRFFNINLKGNDKLKDDFDLASINDWLNHNIGYTSFILGLLFAFWLWIFFKKQKYNFFEVAVLLCYYIGITLVIAFIFIIFAKVLHYSPLVSVGFLLGFLYLIYALSLFFGRKKILTYVKIILSFVLTYYTYMGIFLGIAYLLHFFQTSTH